MSIANFPFIVGSPESFRDQNPSSQTKLAPKPSVTDLTSSSIRLNSRCALISLTLPTPNTNTNEFHALPVDTAAIIKGKTNGHSATFLVQDHKKDSHPTGKPPLPSSVLSRAPSRHHTPAKKNSSTGQVTKAWANNTTPRMRVPMEATYLEREGLNCRPVTPLVRGFPPGNEIPFVHVTPPANSIRDHVIERTSSKFLYNGPHQIYGGPLSSKPSLEASSLLKPLFNNTSSSSSTFQSPHPLVEVGPNTTLSAHSKTETEMEFIVNALRKSSSIPVNSASFESYQRGFPLGAKPSLNEKTSSQPPSMFPSASAMAQMEVNFLHSSPPNLVPVAAPVENKLDFRKVETLLNELLDYKDTLNKNIQSQNQLIDLINRRFQPNSQQRQKNFQYFPEPHQQQHQHRGLHEPNRTRPAPQHYLFPPQRHYRSRDVMDKAQQKEKRQEDQDLEANKEERPPDPTQWHTLSATMVEEPSRASTSTGSTSDSSNYDFTENNKNKIPWPDGVIMDFPVNIFMEPDLLAPSDTNANPSNSIDILQTTNFEEFQRMAEQSQSGFSVGAPPKQNPFLAGAKQQLGKAPLQFYPLDPVVTPPTSPIIVSPNDSYSQQGSSMNINYGRTSPPIQIQVAPKHSSQQYPTVQQKYQQYMHDKNFQSLSPSSFKGIQPAARESIMRKPVAVALKNSPSANRSQANFFSANADVSRTVPFTLGTPLDVRLLTPDENRNGKNAAGAMNNLEGMQELSQLLSQLPVLTRKQKVEEFRTYSTLSARHAHKPAVEPVAEEESITSMVPQTSSNGTVVSEKRSLGTPPMKEKRPQSQEMVTVDKEDEEEFRNLNTNKMSMHELVSLGRKIYRILSQLSTNTTNVQTNNVGLNSPLQSVIATPITLNVPTPNTPVFTSRSTNALVENILATPSGNVTPQLIVDFNTMPNPTFVTGPSSKASTPNQQQTPKPPQNQSRTGLQTPNLFRKVLQPPPTRWGGKKQSPGPPSASVSLSGILVRSPRSRASQQKKEQKQLYDRRSLVSLATGKSNNKRVKKPPSHKRAGTPIPARTPPTATYAKLPDSFVFRDKFSNNFTKRVTKKQQRQSTPYPYQSVRSNTNVTVRSNVTAVTPTRTVSRGIRNFIQENISKVAVMRKFGSSHVRTRLLPPVNTKKYEHITSTIRGSRSRSNSRARGGPSQYKRSSSVPVTPAQTFNSKRFHVRSISTPRPSTGMSVHAASSRSQSPAKFRPTSRVGGVMGLSRPVSQASMRTVAVAVSSIVKGGKSKVGSVQSTVVGKVKVNTDGGNNKTLVLGRKSRSKTKRSIIKESGNSKDRKATSSASSVETRYQLKQKKLSKIKSKNEPVTVTKNRKNKSMLGEAVTSDFSNDRLASASKGQIFNTESEQRLIRDMVKAEMNMMVQRHVKIALREPRNQIRSVDRATGGRGGGEEDNVHNVRLLRQPVKQEIMNGTKGKKGHRHQERSANFLNDRDDKAIELDNLTPVYTPPKYYDESLFSLEKWVNPEIGMPETAYTSAKETPVSTANSGFWATNDNVETTETKDKIVNRLQTVRFSLPTSK